MAPSQIQVAISSLQRLLKEENSYYKEQEQQETRIAKLEKDKTDEDGNREFTLKQEVITPLTLTLPRFPSTTPELEDLGLTRDDNRQRQALEETKKVIPTLRERITSARERLENMLVCALTPYLILPFLLSPSPPPSSKPPEAARTDTTNASMANDGPGYSRE